MPSPMDMQRQQMAQRLGGAPPGGMMAGPGSPPPQGAGMQQPPGGAPQTSQLEPLLQQVLSILVQGNPADLEAFGRFMGTLQSMVQEHGAGQGAPMGGQPMGAPPPMGR